VNFDGCSRDARRSAATTLALGVEDVRRVEALAECLPVGDGFVALAEALRCTDCHTAWDAAIGDVLTSFRGADTQLVHRLTEQASLSPQERFATCDRDQVAVLAIALEQCARDLASAA